MRRDYTKQYGYICPTENSAVYFADRKPQPSRPKHSGVLREGALKQMDEGRDMRESVAAYFDSLPQEKPTPKPKDENLKRVRNLYTAITAIAAMMDMSIDDITIKAKGDPSRYKTSGPAQTIERVEV